MDKFGVLKQYFGYDSFRDGQEELIDVILAGGDCLGVMPTGAGKSICYQLPALLMDGITLVISPLISLMKDQVGALTQAGVSAAYLNSSLTERQSRLALDNARHGRYRIIYIAPERLQSESFISFAKSAGIAMVTVDEAHCISQWGQDFRPSYLDIREFVDGLPNRPVLSAYTATATSEVREDIVRQLRLVDPYILVTGFDRKNLYFEVQKPGGKSDALLRFLSGREEESGIVYCATRGKVEEVCDLLLERGYSATRYHAGLGDAERRENQDDFLYDRAKVIVATNAFGMGIDKSNVRYVVHYNMPKNVESYYQEAGRAGRDGDPASCLLLYSGQDVRTAMFLIDNSREAVEDPENGEILRERDRQRLRAMTFYCHSGDCLRGYILRYFGEKPALSCENCANCLGGFEKEDVTVEAQMILSCVARMKSSYGVKMVIDVLRGAKGERIRQLGLDKLTTFGICRESKSRLRDIINGLIMRDYLRISDGQYPMLLLGDKAGEVLRGGVSVKIKLAGKKEKPERGERRQSAARPVDRTLFGRLAALRGELAREQRIPAYMVFADSALTDMCVKLPLTKEEFLDISGVGRVKLERYGDEFLDVIAGYVRDNPKQSCEQEQEPGPSSDIMLSDEPMTVSAVADKINCVLMERGLDKVSAAKLNL